MATPPAPTPSAPKGAAKILAKKKPSNQPRPAWKPVGHNVYTHDRNPYNPPNFINNRPLKRNDLHQSTPDILGSEENQYSTTQKEHFQPYPLEASSRSKSLSMPSNIDQIEYNTEPNARDALKPRAPYASDDHSFVEKRLDYKAYEPGLELRAEVPNRSFSQPYGVDEPTPYERKEGPVAFAQGMDVTQPTRPTESQPHERPYAADHSDMEVYNRPSQVAYQPGMDLRIQCASPTHSDASFASWGYNQDPFGYGQFVEPPMDLKRKDMVSPETVRRHQNDPQMDHSVCGRISSPRPVAPAPHIHFGDDPLPEDTLKRSHTEPAHVGPQESIQGRITSPVTSKRSLSPNLGFESHRQPEVNPFIDPSVADVAEGDNVKAGPGGFGSDGYMSDDSIDNSPRRLRRQLENPPKDQDGYHSDSSDMSVDSIDLDKENRDKTKPEDRSESPDRKQVSFQIDWEPAKTQPPRRKATSPGELKSRPKFAKRDPIPAPESSVVYDSRMAPPSSSDAPRYGRKKINLKPRVPLSNESQNDSLVFGHPLNDDQRDTYIKKPNLTQRRAVSVDNLSHKNRIESEKRSASHENLSRKPMDSKRTESPATRRTATPTKAARPRSFTPDTKKKTPTPKPRSSLDKEQSHLRTPTPDRENQSAGGRSPRSPVERKIASSPARKPNLKVGSKTDSGLNDKTRQKSPEARRIEMIHKPFVPSVSGGRVDSGLRDKNRLKSPDARKVELVNKPFFAGNVTSRVDSGMKGGRPKYERPKSVSPSRSKAAKQLSSSTGDLRDVGQGGLKPSTSLTNIAIQTSPSLRRSTSDVAIQTDEENLNSSSEMLDRGIGTSDVLATVKILRPVSNDDSSELISSSSDIPTNKSTDQQKRKDRKPKSDEEHYPRSDTDEALSKKPKPDDVDFFWGEPKDIVIVDKGPQTRSVQSGSPFEPTFADECPATHTNQAGSPFESSRSEPMLIDEPVLIEPARVAKNRRTPNQDLLAEFDVFGPIEPRNAPQNHHKPTESSRSDTKSPNLVEFDLEPRKTADDQIDFDVKHSNDPWTVQFETPSVTDPNKSFNHQSPRIDSSEPLSHQSSRIDSDDESEREPYHPSHDPKFAEELKRYKLDDSSIVIVEKPMSSLSTPQQEFQRFKPNESSLVTVDKPRSGDVSLDDFEPYAKPKEPTSGFSSRTDSPKVSRPEKIDLLVSDKPRGSSSSSSSSSDSSKTSNPDRMRKKVVKRRQPKSASPTGPKVFELPDDFYDRQARFSPSSSSGRSTPVDEQMSRSCAERLSPKLEDQLKQLDRQPRRRSISSSSSSDDDYGERGRTSPRHRGAKNDGRTSPLLARVTPNYSKPPHGDSGALADIEISIDFEEERKEDANEQKVREIVTIDPDCKTVTTENVPHIDVSLAHLGDTPRPSDASGLSMSDNDDGRPEITQTYGVELDTSVDSELSEAPIPISSSTPLPPKDRPLSTRRSSTSSTSTLGADDQSSEAPLIRPHNVENTHAPLVDLNDVKDSQAEKPMEYMIHGGKRSYDPDIIIIDRSRDAVHEKQPDVVSYPEPAREPANQPPKSQEQVKGRPLTRVRDRISSFQQKPDSLSKERIVPARSSVRNMASMFEQKPEPSPEPIRRHRSHSPAQSPFLVSKRPPTPASSDSENERRNGRRPTETMKNVDGDPRKKKKERRKKGKEDYRLEKVEPPQTYQSSTQMDVNGQKDKKFVFVPLEFQFDLKPMVIIDKDNQNASKREVEIAPQNLARTECQPEPVLDDERYHYQLHFSPMNPDLVASDTEDISDVASSLEDEPDVDVNDVVSLHSDSSPNAYYTNVEKPTMYYVEQNGDPSAFPRIYRHPRSELDSSMQSTSDSSTSPASSLRGARLWTGVGKYSPHGARTERRIQSEIQRMPQNEAKTHPVTHAMDQSAPEGYNELKGPQVFVAGNAGENACATCGTRVYEMEKLVAEKQIFHKNCFKCSKCKRTLGVGNYATNEGKLLCKPHFMEIFRLRDGVRPEDGEDGDGKIVRSEDKIEDDREGLPSLKNIKSRFENVDGGQQQAPKPAPGKLKYTWSADAARNKEVSPSPPRDPDIVREEKSREHVPIASGGIGSIKQQYMATVSKPAPSAGPPQPIQIPRQTANRTESSPSPARDPNVVRAEDVQDEGQFMPPPQTTRGLVARFKQLETEGQGQVGGPAPEQRLDLLEQERQIPDSGEFTNRPQVRDDVVTEWDEVPEQELPEVGAAKSRINMFRQKEKEVAQKPPPAFGDLYSPGGQMVNGDPNQKRMISSERPVNNQPDVIRHEESSTDQRPPQDLTKNMLSKFRQMEAEAKNKKEQEWISPRKQSLEKPKISAAPRWQPNENGTDDVDRPLFNPAKPEGGEFENSPQDLPDVVRESDPFDENELPEIGVTKNLLAKFKAMQT